MASRAYRELLKAQRVVFNQDFATLRAARIETRSQFMLNANAPVEKVPQLLQDASDAAHFMKANVAQTVRNDSGNYELNPRPEHLHRGTTPPPLPCSSSGEDFNRRR
uniref:Complex 1 LYR protein n=1 Tax=Coccolithus braarudii TaxID=221442 RepID=A0A7S0PZP1_9EUKA